MAVRASSPDPRVRCNGSHDERMGEPRWDLATTLLVTDLDGTLLGPEPSLSRRSISVVNNLITRGGAFSYATARSFTSASVLTAGLALQLPVATYGGAVIVDPRTGRRLGSRMLPADVVRSVLAATSDPGAPQPILFAEHDGRDRVCWRPTPTTPFVQAFLDARPGDPRLLPLDDWSQIDPAAVFYLALIGPEARIGQLAGRLGETLAQCSYVLGRDIYDGAHWLELTSATATKAAAVKAIAELVGATRVICFGDNVNDLPMFEVADFSLAVANAAPQVRSAASAVIGANTDDGVAEWIAQWLEHGG
jgi:hydroxymethylpyrimidine pyrophosphatase-like HAD family hydrolase